MFDRTIAVKDPALCPMICNSRFASRMEGSAEAISQPEASVRRGDSTLVIFFFARRPIGSCNLVLFVHHRLMRGEKSVHDSRIGAEPFVHCEGTVH